MSTGLSPFGMGWSERRSMVFMLAAGSSVFMLGDL